MVLTIIFYCLNDIGFYFRKLFCFNPAEAGLSVPYIAQGHPFPKSPLLAQIKDVKEL